MGYDTQRPAAEAGAQMPGELRERLDADFANITPPKSWGEAIADERIERLRDVVRNQDAAIRDLRQMVHALLSHTHGMRGELLGPIYPWGANAMSADCCRWDPLA